MIELTHAEVKTIVSLMNQAGFDVSRVDFTTNAGETWNLAFTCPPRSRLMFGAVISSTMQVHGRPELVNDMLIAGHTHHVRGEGLTLYFPGYAEERTEFQATMNAANRVARERKTQ